MIKAQQTPLVELLQKIPEGHRTQYESMWNEEGHPIGHTMCPIGRLAHQAADEIEQLQARVAELEGLVHDNHREQASLPEFLLEMSRQMREQPSRATAHPFWQVRCKRYLPTEQGYNESHYEVEGDEGPVYSSNTPLSGLAEYLLEHHESWCRAWASENHEDDADYTDAVSNWIDPEYDLPAELTLVYVQEIEEVVTTHLTQAGAEAFIKRKQHDYPKLYTYVESAYWSPQLRELQDWIIGLTPKQEQSDV
jgi:hypothetical protein